MEAHEREMFERGYLAAMGKFDVMSLSATPSPESLFTATRVARVTAKAEAGLIAAMEWMPYLSDIDGEAKTLLALALERMNIALDAVRETRSEAERRIVAEATAE